MGIDVLLIGVAILISSVRLIIKPFLDGRRQPIETYSPEMSYSENPRREVLIAISDLDFDHKLGKVSDEDYQQFRPQLLAEAATHPDKTNQTSQADNLDDLIQTRREFLSKSYAKCSSCGSDLGESDKFCTQCGKPTNPACTNCGQEIYPYDKFCSECGTVVANKEE